MVLCGGGDGHPTLETGRNGILSRLLVFDLCFSTTTTASEIPEQVASSLLWLVVLFVSVLQEGKVLPCVVILYLHPVVIGLWMIPYPLRGLKAVILSHKGGFARAVDVLSEHF